MTLPQQFFKQSFLRTAIMMNHQTESRSAGGCSSRHLGRSMLQIYTLLLHPTPAQQVKSHFSLAANQLVNSPPPYWSKSNSNGRYRQNYSNNNNNNNNNNNIRNRINRNPDNHQQHRHIKKNGDSTLTEAATNPFFATFESEIMFRKDQANRTVYFKSYSKGFPQLVKDLENFELKISNIIQFSQADDFNEYLVEFETNEDVAYLLNNCERFKRDKRTSCSTRMIYHRSNFNGKYDFKHFHAGNYSLFELPTGSSSKDAQRNKHQQEQQQQLLKEKCAKMPFNEQIKVFYKMQKISDASMRMRFFVASLIEEPLRKGIFQDCSCMPFGSSLNMTGMNTSDLDLYFSLEGFRHEHQAKAAADAAMDQNDSSTPFRFITNKDNKNTKDRQQALKYFNLIEFLFKQALPQFKVNDVVSGAKVPIIRFEFKPFRMECDLAMSRPIPTFDTTHMFWLYNNLDGRVGPLMMVIKRWAQICGVTQKVKGPNPFISSYQLSMLIIFYLQKRSTPILCDSDDLFEIYDEDLVDIQSDQKIKFRLKSNLNLQDLKQSSLFRQLRTNNAHLGLSDLFVGFFEFYEKFDFKTRSIHLTKNQNVEKPIWTKLYIESPFDRMTNTSGNVNESELSYFQNACHQTLVLINEQCQSADSLDLIKIFDEILKNSQNDQNINNKKINSLTDIVSDEFNLK